MPNKVFNALLDVSFRHIRTEISPEKTPELLALCRKCEKYSGEAHDYYCCKSEPCFRLFLGYEYLRWEIGEEARYNAMRNIHG